MATPATTPIPAGMHTLTAHIICEGAADAIAFYKKAFNAEELARLPGPNGKIMHAAVRIGDSVLMLMDDFAEWGSLGPKALKGTPVTLHLYVKDVDAAMKQAVDAGATLAMPAEDMFWGDRYGQVVDRHAPVRLHARRNPAEHGQDGRDVGLRRRRQEVNLPGRQRARRSARPALAARLRATYCEYGPRKSSLPIFTPALRRIA
jgi:PhnB protein